MAIELNRCKPAGTHVVAVDFCLSMLRMALAKKQSDGIAFVVADAAKLPFREGTFSAATISFATRNINTDRGNLGRCYREIFRILRQGATFVNLETSQPRHRPMRSLFHAYVRAVARPIGMMISGSRLGYVYLSRTIPRFFTAEQLTHSLNECGFKNARFTRMFLGVIALHVARR